MCSANGQQSMDCIKVVFFLFFFLQMGMSSVVISVGVMQWHFLLEMLQVCICEDVSFGNGHPLAPRASV